MSARNVRSFAQVGSALALVIGLAGCTKGGQFDPTELLNNDVFNSKKPITGQREPVFPNGVPGATTGVPPDLVKGYQPPPDQAANSGYPAAPGLAAPAPESPPPQAAAAAAMQKPKPKVVRAPARPQNAAVNQNHPATPTRISVGVAPKSAPTSGQKSDQSIWPATPQTAASQQAPQPAQTNWPAPPPTGAVQQTAQPAQSIWPNPPAPGQH
jgi:hypothetical protein